MANFLKLLLLRYLPALAKKGFAWKRLREEKSYWASLDKYTQTATKQKTSVEQPRLLIVLPSDNNVVNPFEPATGNYHYEIFRSSQERYGSHSIVAFYTTQNRDWVDECRLIVDKIYSGGITHLLFYIESYEVNLNIWRWDILASELTRSGSNVTAIGFLTDGTYELHQIQCNRFYKVYPHSLFIQIDVLPTSKYVKDGRLVGPTFLPISSATIEHLNEHFLRSESGAFYELSFIGKLYGYRQKTLRQLLKKGLDVTINPQAAQADERNASYLEYMDALRRSKYTINFARANGTRQKQLKSRILESVLVGSIPVTDDDGLTEQILPSGTPFISFKRSSEILDFLDGQTLEQASSLSQDSKSILVSEKVRQFANSHFWETLEKGLSSAGLETLIPRSKTR